MTNKYRNSKIYSIRNTINEDIYIGATSSDLCKRMVKHRSTAKQEPHKSPFHTYMNENGIENFYIEIVEEFRCENIEQLRKREGEIMREVGSLNKQIAGRPKQEYKKEYSQNNKDKTNQRRNERRKENPEKTKEEYKKWGALYRERHPEKIKAWHTTKVECECGGKYTLSHKAQKLKSKKHQNYLNIYFLKIIFKYKKVNAKTGNKVHLHKSPLSYSPFLYQDTKYLEHLHHQLKLRNSREAMRSLRKDMIESNNRANYQNDKDRIKRELERPNLSHPTKEHLEQRLQGYRDLFKF